MFLAVAHRNFDRLCVARFLKACFSFLLSSTRFFRCFAFCFLSHFFFYSSALFCVYRLVLLISWLLAACWASLLVALPSSGFVLGSLDLLGSPGVLAREVKEGLRDAITLPYQGLFGGPQEFLRGVSIGTKSLLQHVTSGEYTFSALT
jgi:hypothetical protein